MKTKLSQAEQENSGSECNCKKAQAIGFILSSSKERLKGFVNFFKLYEQVSQLEKISRRYHLSKREGKVDRG